MAHSPSVSRFAERTAAPQAATFAHGGPLGVPSRLSATAGVVGDLLTAVAVVLCIPFVILAIGIPIALCVRLLVWSGGLF